MFMICPICNRPLKSAKSILKGIGPVCERKLEQLKNEPPKDQISFTHQQLGEGE